MAIAFSTNIATMPKDGSTLAVLYCTYSTATGAVTGRFVRMLHWDAASSAFVEDQISNRDVASTFMAWVATGSLPI